MGRLPVDLPEGPNTGDLVQHAAFSGLNHVLNRALDVLNAWRPQEPDFVSRTSFQVLGHALQLMFTGQKLLQPGEQTFPYAQSASMCLRSLADVHARQLDVWSAARPTDRLDELLADSRRQELLGLDAGKLAGLPTESLRERLALLAGASGTPRRPNVTATLEEHQEWEALCVYRWESVHVHTGAAAIAAGGRTLQSGAANMDVAMWPVSVWRVGQLTWALYGLGLRTISHIARRIELPADDLWELDGRMRPAAKAAALEIRSGDEPPSPQYGLFEFPLYPVS